MNGAIMLSLDLPQETIDKAMENLFQGRTHFVILSGKIGSGKDTVAPRIMKELGLPKNSYTQEYFAKPLKQEMQTIIDLTRAKTNISDVVFTVAKTMNVEYKQALKTVSYLRTEVRKDRTLTSYTKKSGIRQALQYWGTNVRREQNEYYWVEKTLELTLPKIAKGESIYITDARFPNESDATLEYLGKLIRLDVSPEEQERRIKNRDDVIITQAMRQHISETALDDYEKFDFRILTDDKTPEEIAKKIVESFKL